MEKEHGRCAYCHSPEMVKGSFICRGCYEKLMLIRKIKAIGQLIKGKAAMEKDELQGHGTAERAAAGGERTEGAPDQAHRAEQ